jgi:hypothetical protein
VDALKKLIAKIDKSNFLAKFSQTFAKLDVNALS